MVFNDILTKERVTF